MNKPNIVFYFSDQQRWDTLGCYGQKLDVSPNLDRLAGEGTRFDQAFTMQPVCGPARACLQTGKYATEIGCWRNSIALPENADTIAKYFNAAGYDTAYIGKWHLASNELSSDPIIEPVPEQKRGGYQYWMASDLLEHTSHGYDGYVFDGNNQKVEFTGYRADCINDFAIDYLRDRNSEKPFFLFISQIEPHHQNDHGRYEGPEGSKERFGDYEVPGDLDGMEGDWAENYPDYLGCCHSLDQNVGRLVDVLKEKGLWDNTILIYTSDHGSHFKTRNFEYKRSCHEASMHVPLIAHGGVFNGGKVITDVVSTIDLPVTLLELAGIEKPDGYQGHSLVKLVQGDRSGRDNVAFAQISESQIGRCIRTEKWKYSVRAAGCRAKGIPRDMSGWIKGSADTYYEDFLYDLDKDPHERNNLVSDPDHEAIRAQLKNVLIGKMQEAHEPVPTILPFSQRPDDVEIDREQLMKKSESSTKDESGEKRESSDAVVKNPPLTKKRISPKMRGIGKALLLPAGMFILMEAISFIFFHESLFASSLDLNNFIRNVAISVIASYALSLNMASGRMDLSLGGQQLIGCIIGGNIALSLGLGPWGVLILSVIFGMLAGLVVGLLFITLRIEAFVLGLGVALVYEAVAASYSMDGLRLFGQNMSLLADPIFALVLAVAVCAFMVLLMNHSKVGLHYDAIRGSQRIAIDSGINITANALLCYVLCGGLIALAGCLSAGKSGQMGTSLNLASAGTAFVGFVPVFLCFVLQRWCPMMIGIPISVVTFQLLSMGLTKMELTSAASSTITMSILLIFMVAISFINSLEMKKEIKKRSLAR